MSMSTELSISRTTDGSGSGCVKVRRYGGKRGDGSWIGGSGVGGGQRRGTMGQNQLVHPLPQRCHRVGFHCLMPKKKEGKVKKNRMGELGPVRSSKGRASTQECLPNEGRPCFTPKNLYQSQLAWCVCTKNAMDVQKDHMQQYSLPYGGSSGGESGVSVMI